MNFKKYEKLSQRTAISSLCEKEMKDALMVSLIGLSGEIGEIIEAVYEIEFKSLDKINLLKEEIGDTLWYLTDISKKIGVSIDNLINNPIYSDMPKTSDIWQFQSMLKEYICEKEDFEVRELSKVGSCLLLSKSALSFVNEMKKVIGHGHSISEDEKREQIFLILMFISSLSSIYRMDLNEIAKENIEKLKKRYPKGFSEKDSISRVV